MLLLFFFSIKKKTQKTQPKWLEYFGTLSQTRQVGKVSVSKSSRTQVFPLFDSLSSICEPRLFRMLLRSFRPFWLEVNKAQVGGGTGSSGDGH